MQIVIDIDENLYTRLFDNGKTNVIDMRRACVAIRKGTPLDKIRAEIEELDGKYVIGDYATYGEYSPKYVQLMEVLQIIDKYKEESEEV